MKGVMKRFYRLVICLLFFTGLFAETSKRPTDALKEVEAPKKVAEVVNTVGEKEVSKAIEEPPAFEVWTKGEARVYVIPIVDEISVPNQYIVKRGLKEAIETGADAVILDINTPGGRVDVMLEMTKQLQRFEGLTIAWVHDEAISAGAFISFATDEIWYSPEGVIGAAAVVSGGGAEIGESMKQKIDSYLQAKMRSMADEHPYKTSVMRKMTDAAYVLEIDGKVILGEGQLLSLTAKEALTRYGNPAIPLFGEGIAGSLNELLDTRFGAGNWEVTEMEITWAEVAAKYMNTIAPILMGLAMLMIFFEFKTPGFGIFGILGICLFGVVFASNYLAGLAGMEPFFFLVIGMVLILVDILFLPGTMILMLVGGLMMMGSILWSLSDIWPTGGDGIGFSVDGGALFDAVFQLAVGLLLSMVSVVVLWKYLPQGTLFDRLVATGRASGSAGRGDELLGMREAHRDWPEAGSIGVVTKSLRPTGEVEIEGNRYRAKVNLGVLSAGTKVVVVAHRAFELEVAEVGGGK